MEEKKCPNCGKDLQDMGKTSITKAEMELPTALFIKRIAACALDGCIVFTGFFLLLKIPYYIATNERSTICLQILW